LDTRWKNRLTHVAWILLFTFGLSSLFIGLIDGGNYINKDYFQSQRFTYQLDEFVEYLSMFELNSITKEEAKKAITVNDEEIHEYRYRYGDLSEQVSSIKNQYGSQINNALAAGNKEVADTYIAERDKKIEDITNNFKSDDYVRAKIIKEKEQKVDNYYQEIENYRPQFLREKAIFNYYLKDTATGEVFTNINVTHGESLDKIMNNNNMLFIRKFPSSGQGYLSTQDHYRYNGPDNFAAQLVAEKGRTLEGMIGVPKIAPAASTILADYHDFLQKQAIVMIYTILGVIAFVLSLYFSKKKAIMESLATERWETYYSRIPIDIRAFLFVFVGILTLFSLNSLRHGILYFDSNLYVAIRDNLFHWVISTGLVALILLQGKSLWERLSNSSELKLDWQKSVLNRVLQGIKEAFLIRSVGTQLFILFAIVFAFGVGVILIYIRPIFFIFYAFCFVFVGMPILVLIVKRTGYFNRIVYIANELASGNFEPDLPVTGRSVLATLAGNINTLKHGVKTLQKSQSKSERLKNELITNVSHDLRTPLTSIITYTELLKTGDLADEDREAYIQIIDRKAQRLKVLIDDLFEASKMASGSIELERDKVDLVQLLAQSLAEHNEAISESTLQFRVTTPDTPIYAFVDGQRLWRVFDNLIGNILKYSLANTRVYISMKSTHDKTLIVFKNVAKYELGENIEELFERFKRGDTSRHTEGSGLGLAIAKSIVDLHDGSLDIEVDGDLFKVTVLINSKASYSER
jgi:signal transduction histidine kinase